MTYQEYARKIAEAAVAAYRHGYNRHGRLTIGRAEIDAIIASVEPPRVDRRDYEYLLRIAQATFDAAKVFFSDPDNAPMVNLDKIIASVEPPAAQEHDAPTCTGWWWAKRIIGGGWQVVNITEVPLKASPFHCWVGPLLPPGGAR